MMTQSYSQQDVQDILQKAIARQARNGQEFSHEDLQAMATELGINPADLDAAEADWQQQQQILEEAREFQAYRRSKFTSHAIKYVIVNGFLVSLDLVIAPGLGWAHYVVLGWGLGLTLDGWSAFHPGSDAYQKAFQKWRQQKQFKKIRQEMGTTVTSFIKKHLDSN
ncbi:MAG: 2TM domain-containing protein [Synechococcaceae cyanobacterium SM2_3_1]|nr:2TM domain-containing protein [Synechococcaceae cyanobacterium SM2_3_1]